MAAAPGSCAGAPLLAASMTTAQIIEVERSKSDPFTCPRPSTQPIGEAGQEATLSLAGASDLPIMAFYETAAKALAEARLASA
jgi:hypothetical protein